MQASYPFLLRRAALSATIAGGDGELMITVKGKPMDWHEGMTIEEVLKRIGYAVPSALVMLDTKVVPQREWAATRLPDGCVLDVQAMMAGG
jgi:thiamine biosynthesis protein ThiS